MESRKMSKLKKEIQDNNIKTLSIPSKAEAADYRYIRVIIRCMILLGLGMGQYHINTIQQCVNQIWAYLLTSDIFTSVYFETWYTVTCYTIIIPLYPFAIHYIPFFDKFKMSPSVSYQHLTVPGMLIDAMFYMTPLMLLDTFMVKKYTGVDPRIWEEKRKNLIQSTRALPIEPPTVYQVLFQLVGSMLLYDALFFLIHFILHKNLWLYKRFHAHHHDHDVMHAHVTNQLSVVERISLVLTANFALKAFHSHPFTRLLFVPKFVWLLVDNHLGYDLPFGIHRIVPFGLVGGAPKHYAHHVQGGRYYQPFLTYLDNLLDKKNRDKGKS